MEKPYHSDSYVEFVQFLAVLFCERFLVNDHGPIRSSSKDTITALLGDAR